MSVRRQDFALPSTPSLMPASGHSKGSPFVASLLDWRLFENPYLLLEDVTAPVVEFVSTAELATLAPRLREDLPCH